MTEQGRWVPGGRLVFGQGLNFHAVILFLLTKCAWSCLVTSQVHLRCCFKRDIWQRADFPSIKVGGKTLTEEWKQDWARVVLRMVTARAFLPEAFPRKSGLIFWSCEFILLRAEIRCCQDKGTRGSGVTEMAGPLTGLWKCRRSCRRDERSLLSLYMKSIGRKGKGLLHFYHL